jgi:uncharacterized protein YecE (DUF72 family)
MARIRLGTQGWNYDAWVGPFYPSGTRPADYLTVYARAFDTVEVDSTFYAVTAAKTVRGWYDRTPAGFTFSLKLPQEITHERRLRDADDIALQFYDRARELGEKLGPVLIQLGPDFGPVELPALAALLPKLPRDIRFAVEFRQRGWINDGVVYVRWMGPDRDIVDYSRIQVDRTQELEAWAGVLWPLAELKVKVYGYVNNHFAGHSPESARELQRLLGMSSVDPSTLGEQMSLF